MKEELLCFEKAMLNHAVRGLVVVWLTALGYCHAQYLGFSYPWQASLWHNAATAADVYPHRLQISYRHRAPRLEGGIATIYIQYSHTWHRARVALGSWAMLEEAGSGRFRQQATALSITHFVPLGKNIFWRLSLEGSYLQQTHGFGQYVFGDQLSAWGNTGQPSAEALPNEQLHAWNLHAATLFHSATFWIGASARYLNQGLLRGNGPSYRLPIYWQAQTGAKVSLSTLPRPVAFIPWTSYRRYLQYQSFDVGIWGLITPLEAGISIEALSLGNNQDSHLFLHTGIEHEGYRLTYSFGSPLGKQALSGHIHELGFRVRFGNAPRLSPRSFSIHLPYESLPR